MYSVKAPNSELQIFFGRGMSIKVSQTDTQGWAEQLLWQGVHPCALPSITNATQELILDPLKPTLESRLAPLHCSFYLLHSKHLRL